MLLLLGAGLCLYFCYHAIAGQRSLISLVQLRHEISITQDQLEDVKSQRIALEADVLRLRPASLDADFLEELAVEALGYQRMNEISVLQKGS
jgi:cell division protein FtsB